MLNSLNLNSWNWKWTPRFTKLIRQQISDSPYSMQDYKIIEYLWKRKLYFSTQYEIYFHIFSIQLSVFVVRS